MNTINLIGNICNDLELKQTAGGKLVTQFNLAVKRPYTKDVTDFIPVVVWNQTADFLTKYANKGSKVAVSGKLTSRKWQDKDGNNRTAFEVICDSVDLLDGKNDAQGTVTYTADQTPAPAYNAQQTANFTQLEPDADLPF